MERLFLLLNKFDTKFQLNSLTSLHTKSKLQNRMHVRIRDPFCKSGHTYCSAQIKGWKLVSHSATLIGKQQLANHWLSLASSLEMYSKICPTKLDFAQSYAEVGQKITCDRPLF